MDLGNEVKESSYLGRFYEWIFDFNILLNIGIYYVSEVMIWIILMEEQKIIGSLTFVDISFQKR
jgi:hypothetical protein